MFKELSHEIVVDLPVADAFPLFTPKGEETWIADWKPTYIRPASGETCAEMIFTTGDGDEKTFWTCLAWQPDQFHVRYLRLTPASRVAFVDVQCLPEGPARTRVQVGYQIQTLTAHGEAYLQDFTQLAFASSIDEWSDLIRAMA